MSSTVESGISPVASSEENTSPRDDEQEQQQQYGEAIEQTEQPKSIANKRSYPTDEQNDSNGDEVDCAPAAKFMKTSTADGSHPEFVAESPKAIAKKRSYPTDEQSGSTGDCTEIAPGIKFIKTTTADGSNREVVADHYNKLEEKGVAERSKSRIFHMRNFNNWIKSMLINDVIGKVKATQKHGAPLRVLDMCCGKGGDLLKWDKAGISHLICTDIAEVSVEQCKERYNGMGNKRYNNKSFSAEFFACDSTQQRLRSKYEDPSVELDLVSCQFAFHYCFESFEQANCMIRNAAECLRENGYFIGTIPNDKEIMKRQQRAGVPSFGNDVYRINFLCDLPKPPLFGAKYNFELDGVVNCPEFLVHFEFLEELAKRFGLRLVFRESFEDFFNKHKESGMC